LAVALAGFNLPNLFGNPVNGDYWGYGNFWEDAISVGLLPFLLGGVAFLLAIKKLFGSIARKRDRIDGREIEGSEATREEEDQKNSFDLPILLSAIIALSLLLALGKNTPVLP
jgi:hypothetical protein